MGDSYFKSLILLVIILFYTHFLLVLLFSSDIQFNSVVFMMLLVSPCDYSDCTIRFTKAAIFTFNTLNVFIIFLN